MERLQLEIVIKQDGTRMSKPEERSKIFDLRIRQAFRYIGIGI